MISITLRRLKLESLWR